jgi:hypothetical protein
VAAFTARQELTAYLRRRLGAFINPVSALPAATRPGVAKSCRRIVKMPFRIDPPEAKARIC